MAGPIHLAAVPKAQASSRPQRSATERPARIVRVVRAKYDAAGEQAELRTHWKAADSLSPDAALTPAIRRKIRERARYEVANNSIAKGIVTTLSNDVVGTGPRPRVDFGPDRRQEAQRVEAEFTKWARRVDLADKLRCMRKARAESGEAFLVLAQNAKSRAKVKLDVRIVEADQVATPYYGSIQYGQEVDGIEYDEYGNPTRYSLLREHPGSLFVKTNEATWIGAENVIHYFVAERPGQSRGLPDITPALPLFALLRRYTLATVVAAEVAANHAGVLESTAPSVTADEDGNEEESTWEGMEEIDLARGSFTALPAGFKMSQLRAEHPTSTYVEFKREVVGEIARCLSMPYNVAAGNSSSYNYSSGRLDHQVYRGAVKIDREHIERNVLDRIFEAWFNEAVLVSGLLPQTLRLLGVETPPVRWMWDGWAHVDPVKEAVADQIGLATLTMSLSDVYAEQGKDWETELRQIARERELMSELGLSFAQIASTPSSDSADSPDPAQDPTADPADAPVAASRGAAAKPRARKAKP